MSPEAESPRTEDPALVFTAPAVTGPGTHVLIVGIGDYLHLLGGTEPRSDVAEGMGQLDAPVNSARALANWFLDEFENANRPLASLALVLSDRTPVVYEHVRSQRQEAVPRGTIGDVAVAIDNWVTRASSDQENQTVFFFCGHGVSSGESILLLRDFGAVRNNRFDGALNLNDFVGAMQTMLPEYQLFLIDACRVPTGLAKAAMDSKVRLGRVCLDPKDVGERGGKPAKQSVHHAASALSPSYGRIKGVSLYTEALIQAMSGGGAQSSEQWWVGTLGLQTALFDYTRRLATKEKVDQQPELVKSSSFTVHKPRSIKIPVYISSKPPEALGKVKRLETRLAADVQAFYDPQQHGVLLQWECLLSLREHRLSVIFPPAAEYEDLLDEVLMISTPATAYPLEPRRRP
jgi:Caspase domain